MLVNYKGVNAAFSIKVGGKNYRLLTDKPVFITNEQSDELKGRGFIKRLIKLKQLEIKSLDSLDKDELAELAGQNGHNLTGKEKVKDLISLFNVEDKIDNTSDNAGIDVNIDKDPAE